MTVSLMLFAYQWNVGVCLGFVAAFDKWSEENDISLHLFVLFVLL